MPAPKLDDCARVLVVEGYDDLLFFAEVLESIGRAAGVYIKHLGGKDNAKTAAFEDFLSPALLAEKQTIGVIVDADDDPAATVGSFEALLGRITSQTVRNGAFTEGSPRIGLHVVPGGGLPGELETLVWQAWSNEPQSQAKASCIEAFLACMKGDGAVPKSPDKGRISALLAVLNDDDPRLGPGARARVFDLGRPG